MDVGDFLETQRNELPCKNHCKFLGMRRSTAIIWQSTLWRWNETVQRPTQSKMYLITTFARTYRWYWWLSDNRDAGSAAGLGPFSSCVYFYNVISTSNCQAVLTLFKTCEKIKLSTWKILQRAWLVWPRCSIQFWQFCMETIHLE